MEFGRRIAKGDCAPAIGCQRQVDKAEGRMAMESWEGRLKGITNGGLEFVRAHAKGVDDAYPMEVLRFLEILAQQVSTLQGFCR